MKRLQGFNISHRFVKIFTCISRSKRVQPGRRRCLTGILNPVSKLCSLARRCLSRGGNRLCEEKKMGQIRLGSEPVTPTVREGHLVVHVGELCDDARRVVVLVIYYNHPLFEELLEQAEKFYGFDQPGRITIPCRSLDFDFPDL